MGRKSLVFKRKRENIISANAGFAAARSGFGFKIVRDLASGEVPNRASTEEIRQGLHLLTENAHVQALQSQSNLKTQILRRTSADIPKRQKIDSLQTLVSPTKSNSSSSSTVVGNLNYENMRRRIVDRVTPRLERDLQWENIQEKWEALVNLGSHRYSIEV